MKNQVIPQDWTIEQADAVYFFLANLTEAVWEKHEKALIQEYVKDKPIDVQLEQIETEFADEDENEGFHDDIPF